MLSFNSSWKKCLFPRDLKSKPLLTVVRSFDVNPPGEELENLKGGVAGGMLRRGVLKVGQQVEIRPGIISKDAKVCISKIGQEYDCVRPMMTMLCY